MYFPCVTIIFMVAGAVIAACMLLTLAPQGPSAKYRAALEIAVAATASSPWDGAVRLVDWSSPSAVDEDPRGHHDDFVFQVESDVCLGWAMADSVMATWKATDLLLPATYKAPGLRLSHQGFVQILGHFTRRMVADGTPAAAATALPFSVWRFVTETAAVFQLLPTRTCPVDCLGLGGCVRPLYAGHLLVPKECAAAAVAVN